MSRLYMLTSIRRRACLARPMIGEYRLPLLAVGMNATVFALSSGSTRGSSRLTGLNAETSISFFTMTSVPFLAIALLGVCALTITHSNRGNLGIRVRNNPAQRISRGA